MLQTEAEIWIFYLLCLASLFGRGRSDCEGISTPMRLTNITGNITSPGYPGNHPSGQQCQWIFESFRSNAVLQIQVRTLSLHSGFFTWSYITLPDEQQFEGEVRNICQVYGLNQTLQNCSNQTRNALEDCTYNQLTEDALPPDLKFKSNFFSYTGSFLVEYKIYNCEEDDTDWRHVSESTTVLVTSQPSTMHDDVTSKMDMTSYIAAPSAVAIFIFVITVVSVLAFLRLQRKHRLEQRDSDRRAENTYEAPIRWQGAYPTLPQSHRERADSLRDSIRVETDLNRQDMASYISHSQLVQYPNQRVEKKEEVPCSSSDSEYMNFASSPANGHAEDNNNYVDMKPLVPNA